MLPMSQVAQMSASRLAILAALLVFLPFTLSAQQPAKTVPTGATEALNSDPITYLGSKIRAWTRDDAEDELGRPLQREDAVDIQTNSQIGETLKFRASLAQYSEVDLTFDKDSRKLTVIYLYPKGLLSARALRDALGRDFVKFVNPNSTPSYIYKRPQRTVAIQADVKDDVVNVMIW